MHKPLRPASLISPRQRNCHFDDSDTLPLVEMSGRDLRTFLTQHRSGTFHVPKGNGEL